MQWHKITDFTATNQMNEIWICDDIDNKKQFNVSITHGKKLNVSSLKPDIINNLVETVEAYVTKDKMFLSNFDDSDFEFVTQCPICGADIKGAKEVLDINGCRYYQCQDCHHVFIYSRLRQDALDKYYSRSQEYQSTFTNKETLETRVTQVALPKAEYTIAQFERAFNKKPLKILDVGAGSGHFVFACRRLGIQADGIEISDYGRQFAKDHFDIEMFNNDFLTDYEMFQGYDIITFWGVVEHFADPNEVVRAARLAMSKSDSMIAVEGSEHSLV